MSYRSTLLSAATTALLLGTTLPALSQTATTGLPYGELSFIEPTGTATNTQTIDVWMRLTLDANSPALNFSSNPLTGFDSSVIPTQGNYRLPEGGHELRDFATVDGALLNVGAGCSGSFIGDCTQGAFDYTFNFFTGTGSLVGLNNANIQSGGSLDFLLGSFTPTSGSTTPGTYDFSYALVSLAFYGPHADSTYMFTNGTTLAQTCPDCSFSRTVTAVPEPATWALMLSGLAGLGMVARRRNAARQAQQPLAALG